MRLSTVPTRTTVSALVFLLTLAICGLAEAQTMPNVGNPAFNVPAPAAPAYGSQPYNSATANGFNHPNDMGYGTYQSSSRLTGHRSKPQASRRYRGY
ncbi:hypothetical protein [Lichenihabitans psoromatis]|uniref:hypothetical protein n=1 Tax=Lichenihabitans psoromatis TaxID=2528642 RepID=UPI0010366356|nr:hypothetical protein [Lichenihabitans psoromatis]